MDVANTYNPLFAKNDVFEELGRFKSSEPDENIIDAETECDDIFFILDGKVKVINLASNGKEIWHNLLGPGTTFGEMASLTGKPRNASVVAVEATRVAILTKLEMLKLMQADPSIAIWMLTQLAIRLHQANETVRSIVSLSIAQRVRGELARIGKQVNGYTGQLVIEPTPNLSELARKLNTDRENVSREVSALTAKGILKKDPDKLIILDPDYLISTSIL